MLFKAEDKEEIRLDSRRLQGWRKELEMIDNINTYEDIKNRINEFIQTNEQLTCKEVDNFISFLNYCERYYLNK